jgi:hypothetical protein
VIVKTLNSTYEVEQDPCRVRRLGGDNDPTDRQGEDGEWMDAESVFFVSGGMLIHWGGIRCTLTSEVIDVKEN